MEDLDTKNTAEKPYKMFERLAKVQEGQRVTITTDGGTFSGTASEVLGAGSGILLEIDPGTKIEITLRSAHQASDSFVYTVLKKQPDGAWKIDERPGDDPSKLLLGGLRISKKIQKVVIE